MQFHAYKRPTATAASQQAWQKVSLDIDGLCGQARSQDSSLIAFLNSDDIVSRGRLSDTFGIPPLFWTGLCQQASGFFWAKDEASQAASNHAPPNATYFRFLIKRGLPLAHRGSPDYIGYRWDLLGFTSHWSPQGGLVMLCFDVPSDLHERVGETLLAGGVAKYGQGPFSLHAMLMLLILESFDRAVWSWRDLVRNLEKTRVDYTSEQRTFGYMHEAARHVIHCSEMLATAMTVTESLVKEVSGHASHQGDPASSTIVGDLKFSISMLAGLRNRSQALEKRIENEINLGLHVDSRHDYLETTHIARLARSDSEVMKGIGILGMVFLPGTFVSAIFSMSFFGLTESPGNGPEQWTLSNKFWLYWAVALPVTALTLVSWYCWQRWMKKEL